MPRLTVTVPDKTEQPYRFSLDRQIVHFGRGEDNDIQIDSGSVSSEHCVMERQIGRYLLKDMGSTNGIKLNGERVETISLRNGQDIHIGDVEFTFELSEEEITALRLEDPTSQLPPLDKPPIEKTSVPDEPAVDRKTDPEAAPEPKPEPSLQETPPKRLPDIQAEPEPLPDIQPLAETHVSPQSAGQIEKTASNPFDSPRFNKLVALVASLAFLLGVAMHFQRSTGESIVTALIHKVTGGEASE